MLQKRPLQVYLAISDLLHTHLATDALSCNPDSFLVVIVATKMVPAYIASGVCFFGWAISDNMGIVLLKLVPLLLL